MCKFDLLPRVKITYEFQSYEASVDLGACINQLFLCVAFLDHIDNLVRLLLDWCMSKNGPEAVVESIYSVMGHQCQSGREQRNYILELRTKLVWHMEKSILAMPDMVMEVSRRFAAKP